MSPKNNEQFFAQQEIVAPHPEEDEQKQENMISEKDTSPENLYGIAERYATSVVEQGSNIAASDQEAMLRDQEKISQTIEACVPYDAQTIEAQRGYAAEFTDLYDKSRAVATKFVATITAALAIYGGEVGVRDVYAAQTPVVQRERVMHTPDDALMQESVRTASDIGEENISPDTTLEQENAEGDTGKEKIVEEELSKKSEDEIATELTELFQKALKEYALPSQNSFFEREFFEKRKDLYKKIQREAIANDKEMMYIIYDYAGRVKMEDATLISAEGALIPNGMKILEIVSNSRCFNIEIAHTHPVGGIPVATEDEVDVVRKNPGKIAIPPIPRSGLDSNIISMMEGATDKPIVYSVIDSGGRWAYDTVRQSRAYKNYIQHLKLRSRDIEGYAALATSQSLYWQDISKLGEAELIASQMYDMFCNQDTQYCALYAQKYPEQYLRMQQHGDAAKQQWTYNMSEKDMERFQKALEQSATEYLEATRPRTSHPSPKIVQRYEQALDDLVDDDQKLLTQNSPSAHYTYSIMKNRAENLENMDLRLHYTPLSDDTSEAR